MFCFLGSISQTVTYCIFRSHKRKKSNNWDSERKTVIHL